MKTNPKSILTAIAAIGSLTIATASAVDTTNLIEPLGWLTANPTIVQTGTKPDLKWNITYPTNIKNLVNVESVATVKPTEQLNMSIRIIGTGVTHKSPTTGLVVYDPTDVQIKIGSESYSQFFFNSNPNIDPAKVVYSRTIAANTPINFKSRYYIAETNQWFPYYDSAAGSPNVRTLFKGDTPPSKLPAHNAPSLAKFLAPYLDANGCVNIGPMDMIVFMELTHTPSQTGNRGYDMQDCVMLVTFNKVTTP